MRFLPKSISGLFEILPEPIQDERGSFARWYCIEEFQAHGLELPDKQAAISRNFRRGTLRGLHYIDKAQGESKLVRCTNGSVFDVAVDLRNGSPTYGVFEAVELSANKLNAFFIPRGVAHGFITLSDNCDVVYQFSQPYRPGIEKGVRWDDPDIAISWPILPVIMSDKDRSLPYLNNKERGE